MVAFNDIPAAIRTPGWFFEIDPTRAGGGAIKRKLLIIGQRLSTGTIPALTPIMVTRAEQGELYHGRGAMLAEQIKAAFRANPQNEIWSIGLAPPTGTAAAGTITVTGAATASGTLYISVAGTRIAVVIASGDTAPTVAAAIVAAINANTTLPVTAVQGTDANTHIATLTCKWIGLTGNTIDVRSAFVSGGNAVAGVPLTIVQPTGGTGAPDLDTVFAAIGDAHYHWFANPFTDSTNATALETELLRRWGPMAQIGARTFQALRGSLGDASTFGNSRNSHLVSTIVTSNAPQPPYIWAAVNAAVASNSLAIDPARPLQTLALPGILPPDDVDVFTRAENDILLFDGMTPFTVDADGTVRIARQITMYQTNAQSIADAAYLDITTPETLDAIRMRQRQHLSSRFPRHKLANDGADYSAGDPVATPSLIRAELLTLYREFVARGWCEDYEAYDATLIVERDITDANRINVQDQPNLVNGLVVYAHQAQFIV